MARFVVHVVPLLLLCPQALGQLPPDVLEAFESPKNEEDDHGDEHYERDILVIANRFPKDLNFFCNPRNELMRDRICYGQVDAYALACAEDTPPLHLVPFCLAFKRHCGRVNYPAKDWCVREFDRYDDYCTQAKRSKCKSCTHDLSCYCEPYQCLWKRYGYETAVWCQRYELFCNEKERRNKAKELIALMDGAVTIHYRCMHLFNLPKVICDPFRQQFDYNRCMKFLFDCELISEWDEEKPSEKESVEEKAGEPEPELPKKVLIPTPEDKKLAEKIAEEEKALEMLLMEKEKEDKVKGERLQIEKDKQDKETQIQQKSEVSAGASNSTASAAPEATMMMTTTTSMTTAMPAAALATATNPVKNPFAVVQLARKRHF